MDRTPIEFVTGQIYKRRDIHAIYAGQQQGGISTPQNYPVIFIFTGDSGKQYGYEDSWTDTGIFLYTGEGRIGDMQLTKGNLAISQHEKLGKDIHVFKYVKTAYVRYIGQMVCIGWKWDEASDVKNQKRKVIVFELAPADTLDSGIQTNETDWS